jgi:hypothetical protein
VVIVSIMLKHEHYHALLQVDAALDEANQKTAGAVIAKIFQVRLTPQ